MVSGFGAGYSSRHSFLSIGFWFEQLKIWVEDWGTCFIYGFFFLFGLSLSPLIHRLESVFPQVYPKTDIGSWWQWFNRLILLLVWCGHPLLVSVCVPTAPFPVQLAVCDLGRRWKKVNDLVPLHTCGRAGNRFLASSFELILGH